MTDARIHTSSDTRANKGGCTGLDNPEEPLKCVFSSMKTITIGTGTTAKKQLSKLLWYVKQKDVDSFGIRKINPQFVPVGEEALIDQDTLLKEYVPEVEIHNAQVEPAMQRLKTAVTKGDKHRENGEPLSAEMEYTKALDVDETNVRATFGLGLVYLDRNDTEKARAVFEQLVDLQAAFHVDHKHLFNEFGIALRKNKLYDEAVRYYSKAVELTTNDENLYYNLSRAFYEMNDWENCLFFALKSLKLAPYHEHALAMCRLITALAGNDNLRNKHDKPPIPKQIAQQAASMVAEDDMDEMIEINSNGFGKPL